MATGDRKREFEDRVNRALWSTDVEDLPRWQGRGLGWARILYAVGRDVATGQLSLWAMSLVYTTILSLVPLLAISFALLKGFGAHNALEPFLLEFFASMGDQGNELAKRIVGFVDNMRLGVLGSLGLAMLVYTVVSLIQKIEHAFNRIWWVDRGRPMLQRFSEYLSVIAVGPVLVFASLGIKASVAGVSVVDTVLAVEPLRTLFTLASRLVPFMLTVAAFTFLYKFIPNTRVRPLSALAGALVAGMGWESVGWGFTLWVARSSQYTAVYSAFATVLIAMIWLYVQWLVVLIGCSVAFYHQHPESVAQRPATMRLSPRLKERVGLCVAALVAREFAAKREAPSIPAMARELRMPETLIAGVVETLEAARFVVRTAGDPGGFVPAAPLADIALSRVAAALRADEERLGSIFPTARLGAGEAPAATIERAIDEALAGRTLADLAGDPAAAIAIAARRRG